jgi:hypothetical protein
MPKTPINSFVLLKRDCLIRLRRPLGFVTFWSYMLCGVLGFGGLAIWLEVGKHLLGFADSATTEGIRLALLTYFPAVGCAAGQQISIVEKDRKYMRSFGNGASVGFTALCVILFALQIRHPNWTLFLGIFCSIAAVLTCWIAIGLDESFHDTDPDAAIGGTTDIALKGETGDFSV